MPLVAADSLNKITKRKVLIIDDDPDFADSTANILQLRGYDVAVAYTIDEISESASVFAAGVALIDVRLGDVDGISLIDQLQKQHPELVCIMVTAHASLETAIAALKKGAYDYLRKPFYPGDLLATLERVFSHLELKHQKIVTEQALHHSEQRFRDLIEGSIQGVYIHRYGALLYVNSAFAEILGYENQHDLMSQDLRIHIAPYEWERLQGYLHARLQGDTAPAQYEYDAVRKDGTIITLQNVVRVVSWEGRTAVQCTVIDVSFRKRVFQKLRRYEQIISATSDFMAFVDKNYIYQAVNDAYLKAFKLDREAIVGHSVVELYGVETFANVLKKPLKRCLQGYEVHYQHWFDIPALGYRYMDVAYYPFHDEDNNIIGIVVSSRDLTETHELSEKLIYQASHDALTGLVNRNEFERRLQSVLESTRDSVDEHALCYVDLDQFKVINDTCGHIAGDGLLCQLSALLSQRVRKRDTLARLGGDEFGLLMEQCSLPQAKNIAELLLDRVREFRFAWEGKSLSVSASIGLVPINKHSEGVIGVLRAADSLCYVSKERGGNRIHVYDSDDAELERRHGEMQLVTQLNQALEEDTRLRLNFQKIISINQDDEDLHHYELLIRMWDDRGNSISPVAFFGAAERYNISAKIDRWVINRAFQWLSHHPDHLHHLALCSINLSGHSLNDENFQQTLIQDLLKSGIPPQKICFEITETVAIANLAKTIEFIKSLKKNGCYFALDDFGTGFCSFAYLKTLPVDYLKIDGVFIKDILNNPTDEAMVKSINDISHTMGKKTIAECVESIEILEKLRQLGIDYAQGYAIGVPTPLKELE